MVVAQRSRMLARFRLAAKSILKVFPEPSATGLCWGERLEGEIQEDRNTTYVLGIAVV